MQESIHDFQTTVWRYYDQYGRHDLPWRQAEADGTLPAYKIWISEIMLQQTQVTRVWPKFESFLMQFPSVAELASASLAEVLVAWSGLGYNRRAKFLWLAAQEIVTKYDGVMPQTAQELTALPGIGINTAGAIMAYAYDVPVTFIETNIRTIFIHHFFKDAESVNDKELLPLIENAVDIVQQTPGRTSRQWYWALMDYGTYLKQQGNASRRSAHYVKQSTFEGSRRQVRGGLLKLLGEGPQTLTDLQLSIVDPRIMSVLDDLAQEGFVSFADGHYQLRAA